MDLEAAPGLIGLAFQNDEGEDVVVHDGHFVFSGAPFGNDDLVLGQTGWIDGVDLVHQIGIVHPAFFIVKTEIHDDLVGIFQADVLHVGCPDVQGADFAFSRFDFGAQVASNGPAVDDEAVCRERELLIGLVLAEHVEGDVAPFVAAASLDGHGCGFVVEHDVIGDLVFHGILAAPVEIVAAEEIFEALQGGQHVAGEDVGDFILGHLLQFPFLAHEDHVEGKLLRRSAGLVFGDRFLQSIGEDLVHFLFRGIAEQHVEQRGEVIGEGLGDDGAGVRVFHAYGDFRRILADLDRSGLIGDIRRVPLQIVVQTGGIVLFGADHLFGIEFTVHAGLHSLEIVSLHGIEEPLYGIFGLRTAAAGSHAEDEGKGQQKCQYFFHCFPPCYTTEPESSIAGSAVYFTMTEGI